MKLKLIVLLLAWYFLRGSDVIGPFESRTHCKEILKRTPTVSECYCVLMFPTDCQDLYA